jgi:hypothetical protein
MPRAANLLALDTTPLYMPRANFSSAKPPGRRQDFPTT